MTLKTLVSNNKTAFGAGVITLAAIFGQLISVGNIFFITTQLFSQDVFGIYSVFLSYLMIFSTLSLLSYEKAVPNLNQEELKDLFFGMLGILIITALVIFFITSYMFSYDFSYLLSIALISNGFFRMSGMINVRNKSIRQLIFPRIAPHLFVSLGLIYLYISTEYNRTVEDLILVYIIANIITTLLYFQITKSFDFFKKKFSYSKSKNILFQEIKFFFLITPSNILNRLSYNLPVILIEKYFGAGMAGQYSLVLRLGFSPLVTIGNSVNQIYHGKIAELYRTGGRGIYLLYQKTIKIMLAIGIIAFLGFLVLAPFVINFFFGENWNMAGLFIQIFSPFFGIMIIVAPITVAFLVLQDQRNEFINQLLFFLITLISFGIGVFINNLTIAIFLFSSLSFIRYVYMAFQLKILHQKFS